MTHDLAFTVGDVVSCTDRPDGLSHRCTVIRVMPVERAIRSYRVRDEAEAFDRAVEESALTLVPRSSAESVFGL